MCMRSPPVYVCTYCQLGLKLSGFILADPSYLLSQCKYQSLAPPPSCCELHSAFSSTRLVSSRSCASYFLLRAARWTFSCSRPPPPRTAAARPRSAAVSLWHVWPSLRRRRRRCSVSAYVCCICVGRG